MYALWDLKELACSSMNLYFPHCDKYKAKDSVWRIPFKNNFEIFFTELHELGQSSDIYIAIFWITIFFAIIGTLHSLYELKQIFANENYEPKTFGSRTYEYISMRFRRQARIIGTTLNIKLYFALIYGMLIGRASYISSWIYIFTFVIPIEIFHWSCDFFLRQSFDNARVYRLIFLMFRWCLTFHVWTVISNFNEEQ